jgi:heme-degrading monooxygenase HmoA
VIAVIFEARVDRESLRAYLDIAAALRGRLETIDGFVSIERFQSLADPDKVLSLSFWRDEAAVARWRTVEAHRAAQAKGRGGLFQDYRLRVAAVVRDYGKNDREQAPADSRSAHGG